ncbi:hypothetical protein [Arthrobacter sp. HMWF013]|uniref:hypothetical protein n=1 Tax=Arthrobacter sp. HMWF013 TaxID=2056849 RepID=UPI000D370726|nr:hypothetical protein [Arthrobacter sp. HMWF013]PTT68500.1 hypothetical protein DBR22_06340 [Arthrobacter sp. HMWF013]
MTGFRRLPGAAMAVGAFVLTVMLGLGGPAASALWQQSADATMTVTASATWPGPPFSAFTCANDNPQKIATISATGAARPVSVTYAALQPTGTYGPSYTESVSLGTTSTVTLKISSQIIVANRSTAQLTIRVTATYSDQTHTTGTAVIGLDQSNNDKVTCISATA